MTHAQLIPFLLVLAAISVAVIILVVRSILREMKGGLGDVDESQRRAAEKEDKRLQKQIERWRDGK